MEVGSPLLVHREATATAVVADSPLPLPLPVPPSLKHFVMAGQRTSPRTAALIND